MGGQAGWAAGLSHGRSWAEARVSALAFWQWLLQSHNHILSHGPSPSPSPQVSRGRAGPGSHGAVARASAHGARSWRLLWCCAALTVVAGLALVWPLLSLTRRPTWRPRSRVVPRPPPRPDPGAHSETQRKPTKRERPVTAPLQPGQLPEPGAGKAQVPPPQLPGLARGPAPGEAALQLSDLVAPSFFQPHPTLSDLGPRGTPGQGQGPGPPLTGKVTPVELKGPLGILGAFLDLQASQSQPQSQTHSKSQAQPASQSQSQSASLSQSQSQLQSQSQWELQAGSSSQGATEEGGEGKSVCIAIPSVPRTGLDTTSAVVEHLLEALRSRSTPSPPLRLSFRVLLYSAACSARAGQQPAPHGPTRDELQAHEDGLRAGLERLNQSGAGAGAQAETGGGTGAGAGAGVGAAADAGVAAWAGVGAGAGEGAGAGAGAGKGAGLEARAPMQGLLLRADPSLCELMAHPQALLSKKPPRQPSGHWLWRTKETIDFLYVMRQCLALGPDYVLFLEEDTWPVHAWDLGIQEALEGVLPWHARFVLSLYNPSSNGWGHGHLGPYPFPCCTQAVLMPRGVAAELLSYTEEHFDAKPVDWLIRNFVEGARNVSGLVHRPSLFQHSIRVRSSNLWKKPGPPHVDVEFDENWVRRTYRKTLEAPS